nr:hypothetical protein Q903MT_gene1285 [Picea sitchensis]
MMGRAHAGMMGGVGRPGFLLWGLGGCREILPGSVSALRASKSR